MDARVQSIMQKVAEYIEATQPQLDKLAEYRELREKRAGQVADALISGGLMSEAKKAEFVSKVAADESGIAALDVLQKLAGIGAASALGGAGVSAPAGGFEDPWDRRLFGEAGKITIG